MTYIALEEAFSIPGITEPMSQLSSRATPYAEEWLRKLPDFTEYRLPEMDANGIDIQVLSLTVPGLQVDVDADTAREHAQRANDYLAEVVSRYPTRFRGFAALPLQDPKAAAAELNRDTADARHRLRCAGDGLRRCRTGRAHARRHGRDRRVGTRRGRPRSLHGGGRSPAATVTDVSKPQWQ